VKTVILVPRRADGGHRDRLWAWCRDRWRADFPDVDIIEGHHDDGPFNRSAAVNSAAREAGEWDVAVLIDSDIVAHPPAVRDAIDIAHSTGRMVVSHTERVMLSKVGTQKVLDGFTGSWRGRTMEEKVWLDSVSCCVAIPRRLFDLVGGFDERFVGWFGEDTAFEKTAETLSGKPYIRLASSLFHLWHPEAPEAQKRNSPLFKANQARRQRYIDACGDIDAIRMLLDETSELTSTRIPRIFHRSVPAETSDEVEGWWSQLQQMHPGWEMRTHRDPLDPADWPLTGDLFKRCQNGAQLAGLVRLECLVTFGGVWVDSDVKPCRSFEPLLQCQAFAGWEDETTLPDAVLGAEANHPAFVAALEKARSVVGGGGGAYESGPAVTTEILPGRADVLCLPPGAFYPFHYLQKNAASELQPPYVFAAHQWHGSWLSDKQRASIEKRQR
jgi:mannosyltransferase OCH1-like enzyme